MATNAVDLSSANPLESPRDDHGWQLKPEDISAGDPCSACIRAQVSGLVRSPHTVAPFPCLEIKLHQTCRWSHEAWTFNPVATSPSPKNPSPEHNSMAESKQRSSGMACGRIKPLEQSNRIPFCKSSTWTCNNETWGTFGMFPSSTTILLPKAVRPNDFTPFESWMMISAIKLTQLPMGVASQAGSKPNVDKPMAHPTRMIGWKQLHLLVGIRAHSCKRNTDRQPVIQVDYSFVTTGNDVQQRTILNATDVQTGLSTSVVVPSKGRLAYSMAELKKFIYETGRTFGILQYDKEPSLKALVTDTVKELGGMSVRATPRDWKQAHGSIGKMQQTLFGQARTLRLQLQDRLGMEITSNNCIFPWIIKHSQFLLNRYMTHEDGQTSYFRRWKKDYQTGLCEFGETVLFRMPGKLKDKADTAWHEGIWLGKDTEADESLVFGNGTMHKVRTVRRVVPSKQWNKKLHQALNVTPWDPKGKDTTDTTFVLPPTLGVAGRIREPPGLELPDTEQAPEAEEKSETDGYSPSTPRDDVESLKSLPRETYVRHPPTERTPNPKRSASDELSDEDTQEHKRLTVGALFDITAFTAYVASVTVGDTEVPVSRNEDTEELTRELALTEPCLNHVEPEFTEEEVKDGMKLEMNSMKGFEVYDEIPIENCSQNDIDNALDCTWVKRRKTPRKVRCRLVARGCFQEAMDTDDTLSLFASFFFCLCLDVGLFWPVTSLLHFFTHPWLSDCSWNRLLSSILTTTVCGYWSEPCMD